METDRLQTDHEEQSRFEISRKLNEWFVYGLIVSLPFVRSYRVSDNHEERPVVL